MFCANFMTASGFFCGFSCTFERHDDLLWCPSSHRKDRWAFILALLYASWTFDYEKDEHVCMYGHHI